MISEGDMVMVVRCCCNDYVQGHWIYRVGWVHPGPHHFDPSPKCDHCGTKLPEESFAAPVVFMYGAPLSWLKKIDPLDEPAEIYEGEVEHA